MNATCSPITELGRAQRNTILRISSLLLVCCVVYLRVMSHHQERQAFNYFVVSRKSTICSNYHHSSKNKMIAYLHIVLYCVVGRQITGGGQKKLP